MTSQGASSSLTYPILISMWSIIYKYKPSLICIFFCFITSLCDKISSTRATQLSRFCIRIIPVKLCNMKGKFWYYYTHLSRLVSNAEWFLYHNALILCIPVDPLAYFVISLYGKTVNNIPIFIHKYSNAYLNLFDKNYGRVQWEIISRDRSSACYIAKSAQYKTKGAWKPIWLREEPKTPHNRKKSCRCALSTQPNIRNFARLRIEIQEDSREKELAEGRLPIFQVLKYQKCRPYASKIKCKR